MGFSARTWVPVGAICSSRRSAHARYALATPRPPSWRTLAPASTHSRRKSAAVSVFAQMPEPVGRNPLLWTLGEKLTRPFKHNGQMLVFSVEDGHGARRTPVAGSMKSEQRGLSRGERAHLRIRKSARSRSTADAWSFRPIPLAQLNLLSTLCVASFLAMPYPARPRRQPPLQQILLLLRRALTTNFVTHCAVSKKVVTQWRPDGPRGRSELGAAASGEVIYPTRATSGPNRPAIDGRDVTLSSRRWQRFGH